MKTKKYLNLYRRWISTGFIEDIDTAIGCGGLCNTEIGRDAMELFDDNKIVYKRSSDLRNTWWASGRTNSYDVAQYKFNTLRQNIVLLLAAMNGEL